MKQIPQANSQDKLYFNSPVGVVS